ncbi:MAG: 30S ribosomal protein S9 [Candidatus Fonsibacter sp.]
MQNGSGNILVNGKKYNEYFKRPVLQLAIEKPLQLLLAPINLHHLRYNLYQSFQFYL